MPGYAVPVHVLCRDRILRALSVWIAQCWSDRAIRQGWATCAARSGFLPEMRGAHLTDAQVSSLRSEARRQHRQEFSHRCSTEPVDVDVERAQSTEPVHVDVERAQKTRRRRRAMDRAARLQSSCWESFDLHRMVAGYLTCIDRRCLSLASRRLYLLLGYLAADGGLSLTTWSSGVRDRQSRLAAIVPRSPYPFAPVTVPRLTGSMHCRRLLARLAQEWQPIAVQEMQQRMVGPRPPAQAPRRRRFTKRGRPRGPAWPARADRPLPCPVPRRRPIIARQSLDQRRNHHHRH